MFRIPSFYEMQMTFDEGWKIIQSLGQGDALRGMEWMRDEWDAYCRGDQNDCYECDDDWFDNWQYEVNAFNVVFENMSKLFAPKEAV